jgi:formylglycine-generating enzyme required for sulfatase activity
MSWIPPGEFGMGSDAFYPEERPVRRVSVAGFFIDSTPVTNEAFARFAAETGYVTLAERAPAAADFPDAPVDALVPGSAVFTAPPGPVPLDDERRWWTYVEGASWRHPEGSDSSWSGRERHPVVHVAYEDAVAYAGWAGRSLPTEEEWELAARGGIDGATYAWGDTLEPDGRFMANTWRGEFPWRNTAADGYAGTSPVGSFPANGYGLHDMIGNVWEWTTGGASHGAVRACCAPPRAERRTERRVIKGGSFLCSPEFCARYRPAARQLLEIDSTAAHVGFRCVVRPR